MGHIIWFISYDSYDIDVLCLGGGLSYLKDRNRDRLGDGDERDVTNISETFKVEKKIRDEEEEMNKYIENELLKRRGIESAAEKSNTFEVKKLSEILDPKSLYELPEVIYTYIILYNLYII